MLHIYYIYFLIAFCGSAHGQAYKIPNVKLEVLAQGFRVSIPDESGISKVLYTIEINEMCPAIMDYVTKATNGFWTTFQDKTELKPQDRLTVFLMVEHNNEVYKTTESLRIEKDMKYRSVKTSDVVNLSKEYERSSCEILPDTTPALCVPSVTILPSGIEICEGDIIFEETFDTEKLLNLDHWSYDIRMLLDLDNEEFAWFDDKPANQFIQDGVLNIVPTVETNIRQGSIILGERCTALISRELACSRIAQRAKTIKPPIRSSLINTRKFFSFKYGRVEVRAQLPKGDWIFPYIMLQETSKYVDDPQASQIRIAFARGNNNLTSSINGEIGGSHLYGGIYRRPSINNLENVKVTTTDTHWGNDFHTYELIWTPTKITLSVDGVTYGEINKTVDVEHFLMLGVSVGGFQEFGDDVSKPWSNKDPKAALDFSKKQNQWINTWTGSASLKVDYIRVYAV